MQKEKNLKLKHCFSVWELGVAFDIGNKINLLDEGCASHAHLIIKGKLHTNNGTTVQGRIGTSTLAGVKLLVY